MKRATIGIAMLAATCSASAASPWEGRWFDHSGTCSVILSKNEVQIRGFRWKVISATADGIQVDRPLDERADETDTDWSLLTLEPVEGGGYELIIPNSVYDQHIFRCTPENEAHRLKTKAEWEARLK
jgi:hypothetical protein